MFRRGFLSIFSIFLIGSLFGVIRVAEVEASETIYIRADGSIDPPTANITTSDNVTYIFIGNINESIVVERNNIVVDGAGYTLQGTGSGNGFNCSSIHNVTIKHTNIKEFLQGILLSSASYNTIQGNNITANGVFGVWLNSSSNNSIQGNYITANEVYGVLLSSSSNNSIMGNTLTDNREGIRFRYSSNYNGMSGNNITNNRIGIGLSASSNNTIQENHITANDVYGIRLSASSNNTIQENHITANVVYGVWLSYSSNDNSIQGNTFIDDGLYVTGSYQNSVENNTVNGKPLVYLEGVSNYTVDDAGQVILVRCENIRVEGLNLSRTSVGVELWETSNSSVSGNNIAANNEYGIYFDSSNYNSISGNNITANNWLGILLEHSSNSSIQGNHIANNRHGISLEHSSNSSIQGNHITANNLGGIGLSDFSNYNSISGNNITDNEYGIWLSGPSDYNSISGNNITANNLLGISLGQSSNNSVSGNHIANNRHGLMLSADANYNSISGNLFTNDGLYVWGSYQNSVENNTVNGKPLVYLEGVSNHTVDDAGQVILVRCENIRVEGLNLSRTSVGVELWETSNSTISGNNITANNDGGIVLALSSNSSVSGNHITNNDGGIWLYWSSSNRIFHNNLINNTNHVISSTDSVNIWDNGYPSGGNYWSNYSGADLDPDGIGDSHHVIASNNTDYYPLMGMFTNFNATSEHYVQTICNSTISEFQHNGTAISFDVTGENGSAGFCRICIPTALMSEYRILVNGTEVDYNLLPVSNSTHSYLYFTYEHSTKEVTIIPEFPPLVILSASIIATLLVAIFTKKRTLPSS